MKKLDQGHSLGRGNVLTDRMYSFNINSQYGKMYRRDFTKPKIDEATLYWIYLSWRWTKMGWSFGCFAWNEI